MLVGTLLVSGRSAFLISPTYATDEPGQGATSTQREYYVQHIKAAVTRHIENKVDAQGIFHMRDDKTGESLKLKFVQVHDPVRQIGSDVYFACTDFYVLGESEKLYDLDFWMKDRNGEFKVFQSKVHKEPRWSLIYGWYKQPRYTFVDDKIKYLYWSRRRTRLDRRARIFVKKAAPSSVEYKAIQPTLCFTKKGARMTDGLLQSTRHKRKRDG